MYDHPLSSIILSYHLILEKLIFLILIYTNYFYICTITTMVLIIFLLFKQVAYFCESKGELNLLIKKRETIFDYQF